MMKKLASLIQLWSEMLEMGFVKLTDSIMELCSPILANWSNLLKSINQKLQAGFHIRKNSHKNVLDAELA